MRCRRVLNDARKVHVLVPLCSGYFVCCQLDSIGTMKNICCCCCCCCLLLCFINNCTQGVPASTPPWQRPLGEKKKNGRMRESERADELRQRTRHFHQFPFVLVKCLKIPTNTCCSGAPASPLPSPSNPPL